MGPKYGLDRSAKCLITGFRNSLGGIRTQLVYPYGYVPQNADITGLLNRWSEGDSAAFDELISVIYLDLKKATHRVLAICKPLPSSMTPT